MAPKKAGKKAAASAPQSKPEEVPASKPDEDEVEDAAPEEPVKGKHSDGSAAMRNMEGDEHEGSGANAEAASAAAQQGEEREKERNVVAALALAGTMGDDVARSMAEAREAAEMGRRLQMTNYERFLRGEEVVFPVHNDTAGFKLKKSSLPPPRPKSRPRKVKFTFVDELTDCIAEGDKSGIEQALKANANVNARDNEGMTPLHRACIEQDLQTVSRLIDAGADVNVRDDDWWTPLHSAADVGAWRICNTLLNNGADPTAVNADGDLPLDVAMDMRTEGVLQRALEDAGHADKEAWEDLRTRDERVMLADMKKLVMRGGNINTPLNAAVRFTGPISHLSQSPSPTYECVMQLAMAGADINATNMYRQRPIVMTENDTLLKILKAVDKQADDLLLSGMAGRGRTASGRRHSKQQAHDSMRRDRYQEGMALRS
ncbi:uncharacterized protein MONBRDRAFT_37546 [Monosiga brevicollis MX1]|uniref:Uncharacterized protein n=1 Tax=Monosiga brevicollis TaxID=81824 RepID=A9V2F1_MONBE|nr:uncharacterized protein MONBRDRAFT_37546 [Monosiga brevicollis MX1]EDQ88246.1 predicted protein [Monosiga brevicollis MX1]|eukprot:XP_001746839.1 hypothetical protein [Monosiga brevicollis MX1]